MTTTSNVPIPDPTLLTTAALNAAIDTLKELLQYEVTATRENLNSKIEATNRLKEEKFKETWERLNSMEAQRLEAKSDNEKAISNALSAQERFFRQVSDCNEEAANKAEMSVTKQIDALKSEAALDRKNFDDKIQSLKERIDRSGGKEDRQAENRQQAGWIVPMIVLGALGLLNLIADVMFMTHK